MITRDFSFTHLDSDLEVLYEMGTARLSGIEKLAQMYIKLLLTRRGSNVDDLSYGTDLIDIIGSTTDKSGQIVKAKVVGAVKDANRWIREMQISNPVEDDEMLRDGKIVQVDYDANMGKVSLKLLLMNNRGRSIAFGLGL